MTTLLERYEGCLLGLACGDAVGTAVEFSPRGTFDPVIDMLGGGPFELQAGQWTDDTSMALCLAASLIHCQGFDAIDQMNRYVNWWACQAPTAAITSSRRGSSTCCRSPKRRLK